MDKLKEIIDTFSEEDKKEFRIFINRQKNKRDRKDLELFNLLGKEKDPKAASIIPRLYPDGNKEAYHALRKRLLRHLMDYVVLKRMSEDTSAASSIMGYISLATHLFDKHTERLAWTYLRKAEKLAQDNEQYGLLNTIYSLAIEQPPSEHASDLQEMIDQWNQNKERANEDERANIANSLIQLKLAEMRVQGSDFNFDAIIQQVLEEYRLTEAITKRPALLYRILSIARSAMLAKKDFYSFEPYVIEQYKLMNETSGFTRHSHVYKLSLLYMIAHVLYRNKKFARSLEYLDELHPNLLAYNKVHYMRFYPRYLLLSAANYSYIGQNSKAIEILEEARKRRLKLETQDQLNLLLNLSVYYFQQDDFKKANRVLLEIHHTDKWCEKKMGREWVLRRNLIELIIQFELENIDLVENRIRSVERNFKTLFENPVYTRVRSFVHLIREIITHPDQVTTEAFAERVNASFEFIPGEREDLLAMGFYAWLKSKMVKKPYYEVLVEIANRFGPDEELEQTVD